MTDTPMEFVVSPTESEQDKMHKERIKRCKPVAQKVLDILAKHQVAMGENEEVRKSLTPVAEEVIAMLLAEDINWVDRHVIFQLATQPISSLTEAVENAFSISWDRALANKWGKDALDLKISDVHNALGGDQV